MADPQVNLSDAELQEAAKAGWFQENPALLNKLDSDSRRRFVRVNAETHKEPTMGPEPGWATKYPTAAGVTRGALSTLPAVGGMLGGLAGAPEGVIGALPGMALGAGAGRGAQDLLTEALGLTPQTSPVDKAKGIAAETAIGAAGPIAVEGGVAALRALRNIVPSDVLWDALVKRVGFDPGAMDLQTTRMRLQAAKSRTRQARATAKMAAPAETPAAPGDASAPRSPEVVPSPEPTPDAAPAAPTAPRVTRTQGATASPQSSTELNLSDEEKVQAERWMSKGVSPEDILNRIFASRKFTDVAGTPTPDEAAKEVARMVAEAAKRRKP